MTLVDTSVWIDHFCSNNSSLRHLLETENVTTHPFVIGELACGNLAKRTEVLSDLAELPAAIPATHHEVMEIVEQRGLWSKGIGWVDAHLLASAFLSNSRLWTLDRALSSVAHMLDIAYV